MALCRYKVHRDASKRLVAQNAADCRDVCAARKDHERRTEIERFKNASMRNRAQLEKMTVAQFSAQALSVK
eukprot:IDg12298t1